MVFQPEISDEDYKKVADMIYERVSVFLEPHPTANYDSYVMMMLVYFIRGIDQAEAPHMQETLQNKHFGINSRVRLAYDLTKRFMKELS